ncbi:MAG: tryptophan-rich sensory protein [Oscillospiraceae bacterium]|nr:tryptophan-rich sensory protein [Oscillospiraceae bacterium]
MCKKIKPYVASVALALSVGGASALLSKRGIYLFQNIEKPLLTPPGIVFPIVWTLLYTLMGISAAIIFEKRAEQREKVTASLRIYALQLAVNFLWSLIFFNARAFLAAFTWLLLLWILILVMLNRFGKISPMAARLQIPYLLWVSFAGYLTLAIYLLNK